MSSVQVSGKSMMSSPEVGIEFLGYRVNVSLDLEETEFESAEIEQDAKVPGVKVRELEYEGLFADGLSSNVSPVSSLINH